MVQLHQRVIGSRTDVINFLIESLELKNYLEIGLGDGRNFRAVNARTKIGVDPVLTSDFPTDPQHWWYAGRSQDYFRTIPSDLKFDCIFIDGDHKLTSVEHDLRESLKHLNPGGIIVAHDCNPPYESWTGDTPLQGDWCGEVWRVWTSLRRYHGAFTVDIDWGCGVYRSWNPGAEMISSFVVPWLDFEAARVEMLDLISIAKFRDVVREWQSSCE